MDMHIIFTYHPLQYSDIFGITNLLDQITTAYLNIPLEYMVPILCNPYGERSTKIPYVHHAFVPLSSSKVTKVCSNRAPGAESFALKVHSFN